MTAPIVELNNLTRHILIPATETEPRNMGADLIELSDGRLLLGVSRRLGSAHDDDSSEDEKPLAKAAAAAGDSSEDEAPLSVRKKK